MKKNDWVYISRKLTQRGQRESVVYHEGILVPFNKVRKNISRQVHPNDAFKLGMSIRVCKSEAYIVRYSTTKPRKHNRSLALTLSGHRLPTWLAVHIHIHGKDEGKFFLRAI
jgi:hypothetical protein